ncbi:aspartate carbamoyltransferase catalytic subunit [Lactobacillus selangorensis]|uniref:Aspartate carbamoyltransferase n=1 Tax=Lactobacillus selangorensis TaxID=81857 RepID=A0A0R2FWS5_9LACO|nr:aspartate carbamoyltransferase catalytic subunit [Lactobacillus selangorensis]KRN28773.1 aspartate carbamoyltransferase catalytic subunit [Lactobacillus selangorensis]KRN32817.1 aspartate carbamoyltransferase catalytic subunit [Lactobacillus selangorensis]
MTDSLVRAKAIVSMADLDVQTVKALVERAEAFKNGAQLQVSSPVYAANLFFENSTRTHTSFDMAERKLGVSVIDFNPQASSMKKGETLYDTCLTLAAIGIRLLVIRHSENAYYKQLLNQPNLPVALINAGDGSGEHPSQSLLDMMTIHESFGRFKGLKVAIVGDLNHSRVARSNMEILNKLGAEVYFSGPKEWYDPKFDAFGQWQPLDDLIGDMDVMMLLRVQHERLNQAANASFNADTYAQQYGLTTERAAKMKPTTIMMHPGPINRGVEMASELVESPQSKFVTQMQNGVFMRMAMIESVLRGNQLGGLK